MTSTRCGCELYRITKPGGLIAIFEHNPWNPLTVHAVNRCPFDENAKLIVARDMARRLDDAGWVFPRIQYNLVFPRALSLLRPMESGLGWLPLGAQYAALARKPWQVTERRVVIVPDAAKAAVRCSTATP